MHPVDQETLARLLDGHGAALVLYAQQWCDSPEDVVQESFIRLMQVQPAPVNVVGWLYQVVRNEAISAVRSSGRRARHESAASRNEPWFDRSEDLADAGAAVLALQSIPMEEREVVVLRIWSALSFEQIAQLIGKSTSTAHRRYEAGLQSLRELWSESCPDPTKR